MSMKRTESHIHDHLFGIDLRSVDEVTGDLRGALCFKRGAVKHHLLGCCALLAIYLAFITPANAENCKYNFHPARRSDKRNDTQSATLSSDKHRSAPNLSVVYTSSNDTDHLKDARKLLSSAEDELRDINDLLKISKTCGPAGLLGRETFGGWQMIFPWSPLRTGTMCKQVSFETTFPNEHDILIFLA
jgi:hypothetical protein